MQLLGPTQMESSSSSEVASASTATPQVVPPQLYEALIDTIQRQIHDKEVNKDAKICNLYLWGSRYAKSPLHCHYGIESPLETTIFSLKRIDFTSKFGPVICSVAAGSRQHVPFGRSN